MVIRRLVFSLLFLTLLIHLPKGLMASSVLERYIKKYKSIKTFEASFEQKKVLAVMASEQLSYGSVRFKGNKLIWEIREPRVHRVIVSGSRMKQESPELADDEQKESDIDENTQMKTIIDNIFILLRFKTEKDIKKVYNISIGKKNNLILKPKKADFKKYVNKVVLTFNKEDLISSIKLIEPSGDFTLITFKNIKINKAIKNKAFMKN